MWTMTLRDLQHRGRQFGIAVGGAAVVFALTLLLTGIVAGFRTEARDTVRAMGADAWVLPAGVSGPFTADVTLREEQVAVVATADGIAEAHPLVALSGLALLPDGTPVSVNVLAHDAGPPGDPRWGSRAEDGPVVVDRRLGAEPGETISIAGRELQVGRVIDDRTYLGGVPVVFMGLDQAREIGFSGRELANAVLVRGDTSNLPPDFEGVVPAAVQEDMLTPLQGATEVISTLKLLMWLVAALIIGAVTYLSALERVRDFAVLKAVGGGTRTLAVSLAAQAVMASVIASAVGAGLAFALRGSFPVPVTLEAGDLAMLPAIAALIGILASLAALRRVVRVDPALAFAS
jgi:putative ABC transport system permease protein